MTMVGQDSRMPGGQPAHGPLSIQLPEIGLVPHRVKGNVFHTETILLLYSSLGF